MDKTRRVSNKGHLDPEHPVSSYFHMALPVVLGSIVTIVYNLADTYFVAQTGDEFLIAGVSVCAPLFTILMAFGNIFGQGGSSLISRLLGKKETDSAGRVSAFCFYIALVVGAVLGGGLLLFRESFLKLLGTSEDTISHAREYGTILMIGAPFIVVNFIHMNLLRCEGKAGLSMIGTTIGAAVNVILDPILIPGMGAAGAALATVVGYGCSDAFLLTVVLRSGQYLSVKPCLHISRPFLKDILSIGITAAITNIASSMCIILVNNQLLAFGDNKIASMGIVLKITMIVQMILVGFSFGGVPLFGFLVGAGDRQKIRRLLRFCLLFLSGLALTMTAVVFLASDPLIRIITRDESLIADGIVMLRWQTAGSMFAGIVMLMTCLCQASGKAIPAMMLSLSRQGVIFAVVLLTAVWIAGYDGILASQCIADVLSAALALAVYIFCWGKEDSRKAEMTQ